MFDIVTNAAVGGFLFAYSLIGSPDPIARAALGRAASPTHKPKGSL